jgi:ADP-ribose pyrophosphatase
MESTETKRIVYRGPFFLLREHKIRFPDGRRGKRIILEHPGAVAALPLLPDGKIIMVSQYRKAIERETLEIPAGKREKGESPEKCIRRELVEETGFRAGILTELFSYYPSFGISNEIIHIYLARKLRRSESSRADETYLERLILPLEEVKKRIAAGEVKDSKTIIGIWALERKYGKIET